MKIIRIIPSIKNTMLKIEHEQKDKLQEIIEKLIEQKEAKDNPSSEK